MKIRVSLLLLGLLAGVPVYSRTGTATQDSKLELFTGADLLYRNITFRKRMYEVSVSLSPAVKWHPGPGWTVQTQCLVPLYNEYGDYYGRVRFNTANVSKEFRLGGSNCVKLSSGLFTNQRFGVDAKWEWAVAQWMALELQAGLTGYYEQRGMDWDFSPMRRITGQGQIKFYSDRWQSELRLVAGRYIFEDYAFRVEWLRHFNNFVTFGAALQRTKGHSIQRGDSDTYYINGLGKIIFMLPCQGKPGAKVRSRLASNWRVTYNSEADASAARLYQTDCEENERQGNFEFSTWGFGRNVGSTKQF